MAIIAGFYVVGFALLLLVMQIIAAAMPYHWYLRLFWFEGTCHEETPACGFTAVTDARTQIGSVTT